MNWKAQYTELKPGDQVIMFKPCTRECACRTKQEQKNCWEGGYKDRPLYILPAKENGHPAVGQHKDKFQDYCYIPKECLRKA